MSEGLQGPALMERMRRHAERFATQIVNDHIHTAHLNERPIRAEGRFAALHLRCPDHRHRRHRQVSGPALRGAQPRSRRVRLRHLRWLLLSRPAGRGGRRRQHRGRGGAVSVAHHRACHPGSPPRQAARREDHAGSAVCAGARRQDQILWNHAVEEVLDDGQGVSGLKCAQHHHRAPQRLPVTGVFIAIGHSPNTQIFAGQLDMHDGYIQVTSGVGRQRHGHQPPGRLRRRGCRRPCLPPGHHLGRFRVHGGAGCRSLPGKSRGGQGLREHARPPAHQHR